MYNLKDIHGRKSISGVDSNGSLWKQFELEYHKYSRLETCVECNTEIEFGWFNTLSPQMIVCDDEVTYASKRSFYFPGELKSIPSSNFSNTVSNQSPLWFL
jgi:hypothetical protein|tara:strand:+ start:457 stop:759 length:303 start_codon:yes stop_codon:yes gene_type:complete